MKVGRRDLIGGAALAAFAGVPAKAASPERAKDEILALAQALEEAERVKDPAAWASLVADDYTELNGHIVSVLKGRETGRRQQEFAKAAPHVIIASYMSNPDVQIFGDVAILCYVSLRAVKDREGRADPACRRVTRIYARKSGAWLLEHSHFSSFDYVSTY